MADKTFSALFGTPGSYPGTFPAYDDLLNQYRNVAGDDAWKTLLLQCADAMPTMVAFVEEDDPGVIYLGHTPTLFQPLLTGAIAELDNNMVVFFGNKADAVMPHVLPDAAFSVFQNTRVHDTAANTRAARRANNTIDPLDAALAGSRFVSHRRTIVLPAAWSVRLLNSQPIIETTAFSDEYLAAVVADPALSASHTTLLEWWQAACCLSRVGGADVLRVGHDSTQPAVLARAHLQRWTGRTVARVLGPLPSLAGPPLGDVTTAVDRVHLALTDAEAARAAEAAAEAARRAAPVTYTDRFGSSVSKLLCRYCRVNAEDVLPELHLTMASYEKRSRDSTTLNLAFASHASHIPAINETNLPKSTPYLLELIRGHNLLGNSFELGEGLNPFSIICVGHPNTKDVLLLAERQSAVENGSSVSLSDAVQFRTKDGRFPKSYLQATDKL